MAGILAIYGLVVSVLIANKCKQRYQLCIHVSAQERYLLIKLHSAFDPTLYTSTPPPHPPTQNKSQTQKWYPLPTVFVVSQASPVFSP